MFYYMDQPRTLFLLSWLKLNYYSNYYFLTHEIAILSTGRKADNFEPHNSLKLSFTNFRGFSLNFVQRDSFLESNFPDTLTICETNLNDSIDSGNFLVKGYLPLI